MFTLLPGASLLLLDGAGEALALPAAPGATLLGLLLAGALLEPPVPGAPNDELTCESASSLPSPALQAVMQAAERHASAAADSRDETEMRRIFMTYSRP